MDEEYYQLVHDKMDILSLIIFEDNINDSWYSNRLYPILKDDQVSAITAITEDITNQKKTETLKREAAILKEKEHEYLEIIDGSTVASWICDYNEEVIRYSNEWRKESAVKTY